MLRHATNMADLVTMSCDTESEHIEVMVGNEIHVFTCDSSCTLVDCS
jgi:hypothetical protein